MNLRPKICPTFVSIPANLMRPVMRWKVGPSLGSFCWYYTFYALLYCHNFRVTCNLEEFSPLMIDLLLPAGASVAPPAEHKDTPQQAVPEVIRSFIAYFLRQFREQNVHELHA